RRRARRRIAWLAALVVAVLALVGAGFLAYNWTQTRYYVGADDDSVVIYRGVQQDLGPIKLSTEVKDTFILLADLPSYQRASVERTINARSYADAVAITERLRASALPPVPVQIPTPEPTAPTPTPTEEAPTP